MSSKINDYIVDYKLIDEFDLDKLVLNEFVPIKKDDFLITVAQTKDASLEYLSSKYFIPTKSIEVSKNELLFLLQDFSIKQNIYNGAMKSIGLSDFNSSYINDFLTNLIEFAVLKNSSDIHIETQKDSVTIRFRINGLLHHFFRFDSEFNSVISSVLKLVSSMDITQKRISQNGRFSRTVASGETYDFRVSSMPTINGESIVLRILDKKSINKNLDNIGFDSEVLKSLRESIGLSQGMILVTGPTGSGKTTTLYSILKELNSVDKKIITIEDPVEYHIENIQQVAVNNDINLGFAEILRDVLRQDPDIILIGEIRDATSLKIAIQASLTGHLVLATLHANDSIGAISRLLDLGAEPFLVATTLKTVISQRLLLKLCEDCKVKIDEGYEAAGCEKCNLSGFSSRLMANEILAIDDKISSMIAQNKHSFEILEYAKENGFKLLFDNALEKVKEGLTTIKEVYRVTKF